SGPAHMATAAGTPVIGLYASTNPERAAPYLSRRWCVNRHAEALQKFSGRDPDTARWGTRVRDPACMDLISVEDVIQKLEELMAARARQETLLQTG
ncbi:MAG: glycosyltransferase family 9 protein, partial [Gammaproteobacteria bacterium]